MTNLNPFSKSSFLKLRTKNKTLKNSTAITSIPMPKDETSLGLRALEQRILLDAAGMATGAEAAADTLATQQAVEAAKLFTQALERSSNDSKEQEFSFDSARQIGDTQNEPVRIEAGKSDQTATSFLQTGSYSIIYNDTGQDDRLSSASLDEKNYITLNDAKNYSVEFTQDIEQLPQSISPRISSFEDTTAQNQSSLSAWPIDVTFDPDTDFSNNNDTLTTVVNGNTITFTRTDPNDGIDGVPVAEGGLTLETGIAPNEIGLGRSLFAGATIDDSTLNSEERYELSFSEAVDTVAIEFGFLNNNIDGAEELTGFIARDINGSIITDAVFRLNNNSTEGGLTFRNQALATDFVTHNPMANMLVDIVGITGSGSQNTNGILEVTSATTDIASIEFARTTTRIADAGQTNNANNKGALGVLIGGIQFDPVADASTLDTDGDGIADITDIDDDNDGILDSLEQRDPPVLTRISSATGVVNWTGDTDTTLTTETSLIRRGTAFSRGGGGFVEANFTNSVAAEEIVLDVVDIDRNRNGTNYTVTLVVTGEATTQDFQLENPVPGITYDPLTGIVNIPASLTTSGGSNISVRFVSNSNASVDSVRVSFTGGRSQDLVAVVINGAERFLDTDNDGIENHLDIDSDNDGITDNIEAQSTTGYVAPSGIGSTITDANMDGLDDNYDARSVNGILDASASAAAEANILINPVDTDSDGDADVLDTDSDNDGLSDTFEAGLGVEPATGLSDAMTDADGDGLFDVFDIQNGTAADDGFDVNESIATGAAALPDIDGDASGGVPLTADVDFRDAEMIDTDGDGVIDFIDVDDDNDGILDINERVPSLGTSENFENPPNVPTESGFDSFAAAFPSAADSPLTNFAGTAGFFTNEDLSVAFPSGPVNLLPAFEGNFYSGLHSSENFRQEVIQLELDVPVIAGQEVGISFAAYQLELGSLNGNPVFNQAGTFQIFGIREGSSIINGTESANSATNVNSTTPATIGSHPDVDLLGESALINNTTEWREFVINFTANQNYDRILIVPVGNGIQSSNTNQDNTAFLAIDNINFGLLTDIDTDGDGIANHLDIDADNDGITDNIEAQTTNGFIAPSGQPGTAEFIDLNQDGLDDNYDDRAVTAATSAASVGTGNGAGLSPVDTDSDGEADILDTDSDNDGLSDTAENGLGQADIANGTLSDNSVDADGDGLLDVFDTQNGTAADDGFDVNESLATGAASLPDIDSDASGGVPLTADVDFRDANDDRPDTDGDGILDVVDVDDDNDGILDTDEGAFLNQVDFSGVNINSDAINPDIVTTGFTDDLMNQLNISPPTFENVNDATRMQNPVIISQDGGSTINFRAPGAIDGDVIRSSFTFTDAALNSVDQNIRLFTDAASQSRISNVDSFTFTAINPPAGFTFIVESFSNAIVTNNGTSVTISGSEPQSIAFAEFDIRTNLAIEGVEVVYETTGGSGVNSNNGSFGFEFDNQLDTDGDGIANHLDIDSDNDGITDNIEAQATAGYIAPSGVATDITDINGDGLDDNYDSRSLVNGGAGLMASSSGATSIEALINPVNSDSSADIPDATPDYLDTDSDNDGIDDATEAGHGEALIANGTLSNATNDADGDGLFDVFETSLDGDVNDGFVVNEGISPLDGTLADAGGDASMGTPTPLVNDLDFRDPNDPPLAQNDSATTDEDTILNASVLTDNGNGLDSDPDGNTLSVSQVNGVATNVGMQITLTSGALLTVNADGTYSYDPNGQFENLAAGQSASDSFTYQISDGNGGFDTATVSLTINGVNDAPVAVNDGIVAVIGGTPSIIDVIGGTSDNSNADTDIDGDDPVITQLIDPADPANPIDVMAGQSVTLDSGTMITVNGDGTISVTTLATFTGPESFDYVISDGNGGTDSATITLNSDGNIAPVAVDDSITTSALFETDEKTTISIPASGGVLGNDSDPDMDILVVTRVTTGTDEAALSMITDNMGVNSAIAGDNGGLITINADGSIEFDPNGEFEDLAIGESRTTSVVYQISDGQGGVDQAVATFTVNGVNDAPDAMDDGPVTIIGDNTATIDVIGGLSQNSVTDTDIDSDPLIISQIIDPADPANPIAVMAGDTVTLTSGTMVTVNGDGTLDVTTPLLSEGLESFDYTITDSNGGSDTATVTLDRSTGSTPPVIDLNSMNGDTAEPGVDNTVTFIETGVDSDGNMVGSGPVNVAQSDADVFDNTEMDITSLTIMVDPATISDGASEILTIGGEDFALNQNVTTPVTVMIGGTLIDVSFDAATGIFTLVNQQETVPGTPDILLDSILDTLIQGITYNNISNDPTSGDRTISFTATDGPLTSEPALATISVISSNDVPTAALIPDQSNNDSDMVSPIDVSDSFTDLDGDPLTFSAMNLPAGLMIDPATGIISGTLDNDASQDGPYTVTITATDPEGQTATINFTWDVTNPAPEAADDIVATPEDMPVTFDVIGNDTDPDGDPLEVTAVTQPDNGSVSINSDGTLTFTPDANFNGTDTFTYTISDGNGGTDTATVTVNVPSVEDQPVATPIMDLMNNDADMIDPIDVSGNFSDVDGDPLTFTAVGLPTGLMIDPVTGIISGTIDPSASQDGPYTVTITATDPDGNLTSTSFTWDVANPAPEAADDIVATPEDTPITFDVIGNDTDPDGDPLEVTAVTQPENGSVSINPDGTLTFTPDANFNGTDTFIYTISDGNGGTDTATVTVNVAAQPDTPIILDTIENQIGNDSDRITPIDISAVFNDLDGDALTFSAENLPDGLMIDPVSGVISGTIDPAASQGGDNPISATGVYSVTVTADDGSGLTADITFTYTVSNPAPVAMDDAISTDENTAISVDLFADNSTGFDIDPDGDTITITRIATGDDENALTALPDGTGLNTPIVGDGGGLFTVNPDGTLMFDPAGDFNDLAVGETRTTNIVYQIDDGEGGTDTAVATLTIVGSNDAPVLLNPENPIPLQTSEDGSPSDPLDLTMFFEDPDNNDRLTISVDPNQIPEGLVFDPETGIISGTPSANASQGGDDPVNNPGVYTVLVSVTDGNGGTITTNVTFDISNPAPIAMDDDVITVIEDTPQSINVLGNDNDPDGDPLIITQIAGINVMPGDTVTLSSGSTVTLEANGTLTYTPAPNLTGPDSFEYMISDGQGGIDTATTSINIEPVNDDPVVIQNLSDLTNVDGETITPIDLSENFSDIDGDNLTFNATGLPTGLMIDQETGVITGTLPNDASINGPYLVEVTVSDGMGGETTASFLWNVDNLPLTLVMPENDIQVPDSSMIEINISDNFNDLDNDEITFSATGLPDGINIDPLTGIISGTLSSNASVDGPYSITITATDGQGSSLSDLFVIDVTNPSPIASMVKPQTITPGQEFSLDLGAQFNDPDNDILSFTAINLPEGLMIDPQTGLISGTAVAGITDTVITVIADDGQGGITATTIDFDVANTAPIQDIIDLGNDGQPPSRQTSAFRSALFNGGQANGFGLFTDRIAIDDKNDRERLDLEDIANNRQEISEGGVSRSSVSSNSNNELIVETLAHQHGVVVQLKETLSQDAGENVIKWLVEAEDSQTANWIDHNNDDLIVINSPTGAQDITLNIRALIDNDKVISGDYRINLITGEVQLVGQITQRIATFQEQLEKVAFLDEAQSQNLLNALR